MERVFQQPTFGISDSFIKHILTVLQFSTHRVENLSALKKSTRQVGN